MRPLRLELDGFTAYREATVVDFSDLDVFAFVGPIGSGKSSIVDAMGFALYGDVPRYADRRLVEPVISQGRLEARVRLDFQVGKEVYTAVRVVRRDAKRKGASTREARLERGEEVLAGNADEVTREVERLLGLTFPHFTKCVVLPQGEFSRFLRDKPKDRQDLLVRLLDLGVYERMGERARSLAAAAQGRAGFLQQRLDSELAFATEEALAGARARRDDLHDFLSRAEQLMPRAAMMVETVRQWHERAAEAQEGVGLLRDVAVPEEVAALSGRLAALEAARAAAAGALRQAEGARAGAEVARAALPERGPVAAAIADHAVRERLAGEARAATEKAGALRSAAAVAGESCRVAEDRLAAAGKALDEARSRHMAHELAATLEEGKPCPVCEQEVARLPRKEVPPGLEAARAAVARAGTAAEGARTLWREAESAAAAAEADLESLRRQVAVLDARLAGQPGRTALEATLGEVDAATSALDAARLAEREARDRAEAAAREAEDHRGALDRSRREFEALRDRLAPLRPPPARREDLEADWRELSAWAEQEVVRQEARVAELRRRAAAAEDERQQILDGLVRECAALGVEATAAALPQAPIQAHAMAEREVGRIEEALREAEECRRGLREARSEHEVAKRLGHHLSAAGFEKWLLHEALLRLTDGATALLLELSEGQYSLTVDARGDFMVVDHGNANEPRPAWTLSGGETFLASLALSLSLAEHLADMAAADSPRLEAIFLDEGFGTLDDETLATVAQSIEKLGSGGRMVGIITHRRELAERVPVRFEVRRGPGTSTVRRVLL